mmetsp:Transcript_26078/g.57134  ORF Transcript_26078/g.57134 Transcript_26078/m.57134 type:complete len:102 (-) Transcript_26078:59-364(-)
MNSCVTCLLNKFSNSSEGSAKELALAIERDDDVEEEGERVWILFRPLPPLMAKPKAVANGGDGSSRANANAAKKKDDDTMFAFYVFMIVLFVPIIVSFFVV